MALFQDIKKYEIQAQKAGAAEVRSLLADGFRCEIAFSVAGRDFYKLRNERRIVITIAVQGTELLIKRNGVVKKIVNYAPKMY